MKFGIAGHKKRITEENRVLHKQVIQIKKSSKYIFYLKNI